MKKIFHVVYIGIAIVLFLSSCHSRPGKRDHVIDVNQVASIFPDYLGVTIPVGIAPMNFNIVEPQAEAVYVKVIGEKGGELESEGTLADFNIDKWHELVLQNKGYSLSFTVYVRKQKQWYAYRPFVMYVSKYALDEWGISYRRIHPSYEVYSGMGLYQRELSTFDEQCILNNRRVEGMCINCHTTNRSNPDQTAFHVRGDHGATFVHHDGIDEWLKAKNEKLGGSMVYPYWHPSGRYCAFSTNDTHQMFHSIANKRIEVYDKKSDILVYDVKNHRILTSPIVSTKTWSENIPVFSPDGKWLYFVTALQQEYPKDYQKQHYNLCRIAFDAKTGRFGNRVDTLVNAAAKNKSITWPRPSYDGRYIMYTLMDYGYFSVWHSESDLWLLDLKTGKSRPMSEVNSRGSESLHNWNVNSHWFFFTSRRGDGLYTRIYFSCMDEHGKATKPFLMPQRDPKTYYDRLLDSYNTPDFISRPIELDHDQAEFHIKSKERVKTIYK